MTLMLRCFPPAVGTANRFGKLPLHFLARNPSLTKPVLLALVGAHPAAIDARDQSGNQPLHYLSRNKALTKDLLQAYLKACGEDGARIAAETPNKLGHLPLRELVTSPAFTDNHLRVMLRVSDRALQHVDRYGHTPMHYVGHNKCVTEFQTQVAAEAERLRRWRTNEAAEGSDAPPGRRSVEDDDAMRLLHAVQKYSLWFNDFHHSELQRLAVGAGAHRLRVSRFQRGDLLIRRGEPATFLGILLAGELGIKLANISGIPRRLQKGALFGERALFASGIRGADVVALTDGYVASMLYSEVELLVPTHPELMRKFNVQVAKAAVEEELAESGLYLEDIEAPELQLQVDSLLKKQERAKWKGRHAELVATREGLYGDLIDEGAELEASAARDGGADHRASLGGALRSVFRRKGGKEKTAQLQP